MEGSPNPVLHDGLNRVDTEHPAPRAVVLPEDAICEEKLTVGIRGVEMIHRTLTKEDRELAAAGYEHLAKPKERKTERENHIDIYEHNLPFDGLTDALKTNFDLKDPGHSFGLTSDEAKARLERDGRNVLTPPKKKSALRKVCASRQPCLLFS